MAGVKPRLHVSGISTDGQFNTVARFQAGGDADSTGAMIVINHGNDRGLAIQGGRISGNYAHGALKMIDFSGRLSDAMVIHGGAGQGINDISFFTGVSTTTTNRLHINSTGQTKLNITSNSALTEPLLIRNGGTGSGTNVGMVFYNGDDNTYSIYDWKRVKEIKKTGFGKTCLIPGLSHIHDANYWHYCFQLNIYKFILESKYDKKIRDLHLVVIHPENESNNYDKIKMPILPMDDILKILPSKTNP